MALSLFNEGRSGNCSAIPTLYSLAVHPGHQPQVFQHIERECLVHRARVYGNETADALQDFLPVSALEIIRESPLLYLLLSGRPLRLRHRTADGLRCCRTAFGITASHPVL